jgi:hypothetical protein
MTAADGYRRDSSVSAVVRLLKAGVGSATRYGVVAAAILPVITSCSQVSQPLAPPPVLGELPLTQTAVGNIPNAQVFRAPDLDQQSAPRCFSIPQTVIASGPMTQFLDVTDPQKQVVAEAVTAAFRQAIGRHQHVMTKPRPDCVTLQLYLTGVTKSTPGESDVANPYATLLGVTDVRSRNLQASVNGTITVAGKFTGSNGNVLAAFVSKVGTSAFDIPADATPQEIARLAAAHLATDIAEAVDREVAIQKRNAPR